MAVVLGHAMTAAAEWKRVDAVPDDATSVTATTTIFSQVVAFRIPAGWKSAHEKTTDGHYILEFIPKDQTLDDWKDMITVQGFRGFAQNPQASPVRLLALLAGRIEQVCGEPTVIQSVGDLTIDSFEAHAGILGCARMTKPIAGARPGQGEIAYYVAIKGSADVYLIHRAVRGEAFDHQSPPMSLANAPRLLQSLQPIKLCERSQPPAECWERKAR